MSGKWIIEKSKAAKFYVPRFVEPSELDPLLPFLPDSDMQSHLQSLEHAPPRNVGSALIQKMLEFCRQSDDSYRAAASKLDNAHRLLARKSTLRYATLQEIAHELLGENFMQNGGYAAPMLYALHRSLLGNDIGFRVQRSGWHRTWGRFEISSTDDLNMIEFVTNQVRKYQNHLVAVPRGDKLPPPRIFQQFLDTARKLIDESQKKRKCTPFGMIGPMEHNRENQGTCIRTFPIG